MKRKKYPFLAVFLVIFLFSVFAQAIVSCGESPDFTPESDQTADDDDSADIADDDSSADDDDGAAMPSLPLGHDRDWDCYLCHAEDFLGAKGEPHSSTFAAPSQCNACHPDGDWTYTNPDAPAGHGSTENCLNCHQGLHEKTWADPNQCLVCHLPGTAAETPRFPKNHRTSWDCYLCHAEDFFTAQGEPHDHQYDSPNECLTCHEASDSNYHDPNAPDGHGSEENCLNCHQGLHDKTWADPYQCLACHLPGEATTTPTYPTGHDTAWDCYLCHSEDFYSAQGEPHGHQYGSPGECLTCHEAGSWSFTDPNAPEGHGSTGNCLTCHAAQHSKSWTSQQQCFTCHQAGTAAPQYPNNHTSTWNCYICHASNFNGAPKEPHQHQYTAPDQCTQCHSMSNHGSPNHGGTPEDHDPSSNCLNCHSGMHGKSWQDKNQCLVCHQF
ncbi:MAG: hypothetical protein GX444_20450 [Myxococcales bacterium]|nr:hypothetical protein [Myxococcales bacterium]